MDERSNFLSMLGTMQLFVYVRAFIVMMLPLDKYLGIKTTLFIACYPLCKHNTKILNNTEKEDRENDKYCFKCGIDIDLIVSRNSTKGRLVLSKNFSGVRDMIQGILVFSRNAPKKVGFFIPRFVGYFLNIINQMTMLFGNFFPKIMNHISITMNRVPELLRKNLMRKLWAIMSLRLTIFISLAKIFVVFLPKRYSFSKFGQMEV